MPLCIISSFVIVSLVSAYLWEMPFIHHVCTLERCSRYFLAHRFFVPLVLGFVADEYTI